MNSDDILDMFHPELSSMAEECGIDWTIARDRIIFPCKLTRGIQNDKKYKGSVYLAASEWVDNKGNSFPTITFMTHKHGGIKEIFNGFSALKARGKLDYKLADQDKARNKARHAQREKQKEMARQIEIKENKKKTDYFNKTEKIFLKQAKEEGDHPYLKSKMGLLAKEAAESIALRKGVDKWGSFIAYSLKNNQRNPTGFQFIYNKKLAVHDYETEKHYIFLPDTKNGSFNIAGNDPNKTIEEKRKLPIYVAEGLATALTVHLGSHSEKALRTPCAIALDAGNLGNVVGALKELGYQDIIIAADNDQKNAGKNPGLTNAIKAALEYNCKIVFPLLTYDPMASQGENLDFNDLYQREGIHVVTDNLKNKKTSNEVLAYIEELNVLDLSFAKIK